MSRLSLSLRQRQNIVVAAKPQLKDIIEALEMQFGEISHFLDLETGTVSAERIRDELMNAIRGKGAFRYFKDTVRRHRIEQDWYDFRSAALRQIAIAWCEANQVEWQE